ncbi:LysR family transcriptional regulator [Granulosicoccaceae sp. 1_MG-2023]|nr:LysR family transcriptional regulator [Granulosicoccaceae sp. 1_MG-2023]
MDIKQLRFLDALAVEKHFGRAAAACCVTQPTLSLRIRQLEEELGLPLILRGNRYEGLTAEGERVVAWARRVLANYEGLYQDVAVMKGQLSGSLRLGVVPSALPFVASLTTPFLARYPDVAVVSKSMSAEEIAHGLDEFTLDAGIAYLTEELPESLRRLTLYHETYVALVPDKPGFPEGTQISWREAAALPLCLLTEGMYNRRIIENTFAGVGCTVRSQFQSNSILTLYAHVRSGRWATIVPAYHAQLVGHLEGLRSLALVEPAVSHPVGLVWRDAEPLSPVVAALCDIAAGHVVP